MKFSDAHFLHAVLMLMWPSNTRRMSVLIGFPPQSWQFELMIVSIMLSLLVGS